MRDLVAPPEAIADSKSREMIRAWIANQDLHVTLNLGMWKNDPESEVDERDAWGVLLGDVVRHIANGLHQQFGWDDVESVRRIAAALAARVEDDGPVHSGSFPDEVTGPH